MLPVVVSILSCLAIAQDTRVSAAQPSHDSAVMLLDAVWSALPQDGVVIYLDCRWTDCRGQVPDWFELEGWSAGLLAGGLVQQRADVGIVPETLEQLWQLNHDLPPVFALALARHLSDSDANALLYVRPMAQGNRLRLSWEVHLLRTERAPEIGRVILRPLPPPLPDRSAELVPWGQHRSVWVGAGMVALGGAMIGGTAAAWSSGAAAEAGSMAVFTTGWGTLMGGAVLVTLPLLQRH